MATSSSGFGKAEPTAVRVLRIQCRACRRYKDQATTYAVRLGWEHLERQPLLCNQCRLDALMALRRSRLVLADGTQQDIAQLPSDHCLKAAKGKQGWAGPWSLADWERERMAQAEAEPELAGCGLD